MYKQKESYYSLSLSVHTHNTMVLYPIQLGIAETNILFL